MPNSKENEDVGSDLDNLMSEASKATGREQVFHFVTHFANTLYVLFMFTTFLFWHYVKQLKSDLGYFLHPPQLVHESRNE